MVSEYILKQQMLEARGVVRPRLRFSFCNTGGRKRRTFSVSELMDFETLHKGHSIDYR